MDIPFDAESEASLKRLSEKTGKQDTAVIVQDSLKVYDYLVSKSVDEGHRILIMDKNGDGEELVIHDNAKAKNVV